MLRHEPGVLWKEPKSAESSAHHDFHFGSAKRKPKADRQVALLDGFIGQYKQQPAELATLRQSSAGSCLFDIQLSGSTKPG